MPVLDEVEVAIIGGGIMGCAAAYQLARAGRSVAVIEKGILGGEASGRNGGGVRQQGRHPAELPLALASIPMWPDLAEELDYDIEYHRGGNIVCCLTEQEAATVHAAVERQRAAGLDVRFLTGSEIREITPALADFVLAGSYCPTDGHANPMRTSIAFGRAAARAGAKVYTGNAATGITVKDGAVAGVSTQKGEVRASVVVNAAGAWAREVGRMAGVNVPVQPRRSQVFVTDPMPPFLSQFISGNTVYVRQARSGSIHIGGSGHWEPFTYERTNTYATMRRYASRAGEMLPRLRQASGLRIWHGTVELAPDEIPILGWAEEVNGFLIATGYSAHGFALGPISGKLIFELITGRKTTVPLEALRPSRFPRDLDPAAVFKRQQEPPARGRGGLTSGAVVGKPA